jgi:hypothetical protein
MYQSRFKIKISFLKTRSKKRQPKSYKKIKNGEINVNTPFSTVGMNVLGSFLAVAYRVRGTQESQSDL